MNLGIVKEYHRHYESCKKPLYDITQYLHYKGVNVILISIPMFFVHFLWFPGEIREDLKRVLQLYNGRTYLTITPTHDKSDIMLLGDTIFQIF